MDIIHTLTELLHDLYPNPDCTDPGCGDCTYHHALTAAITEIRNLRNEIDQLRNDALHNRHHV